jgi:hypothetical protein
VPQWVVADRGLSSHAFREHIWTLGARPAIPSKRNEEEVACPDWIYANRSHVLRCTMLPSLVSSGQPWLLASI